MHRHQSRIVMGGRGLVLCVLICALTPGAEGQGRWLVIGAEPGPWHGAVMRIRGRAVVVEPVRGAMSRIAEVDALTADPQPRVSVRWDEDAHLEMSLAGGLWQGTIDGASFTTIAIETPEMILAAAAAQEPEDLHVATRLYHMIVLEHIEDIQEAAAAVTALVRLNRLQRDDELSNYIRQVTLRRILLPGHNAPIPDHIDQAQAESAIERMLASQRRRMSPAPVERPREVVYVQPSVPRDSFHWVPGVTQKMMMGGHLAVCSRRRIMYGHQVDRHSGGLVDGRVMIGHLILHQAPGSSDDGRHLSSVGFGLGTDARAVHGGRLMLNAAVRHTADLGILSMETALEVARSQERGVLWAGMTRLGPLAGSIQYDNDVLRSRIGVQLGDLGGTHVAMFRVFDSYQDRRFLATQVTAGIMLPVTDHLLMGIKMQYSPNVVDDQGERGRVIQGGLAIGLVW